MDLFSAVHSYFCIGIFKIYFCLCLSFWRRLIVGVDVKSNPGPSSDKRVPVYYSNIRGLNGNLDELAVSGSKYDVLVCPESKVSDRRHLSEPVFLALVVPNRGCRTPLLVPRVWLFMIRKDSAPSDRASWSFPATNPACFTFGVG